MANCSGNASWIRIYPKTDPSLSKCCTSNIFKTSISYHYLHLHLLQPDMTMSVIVDGIKHQQLMSLPADSTVLSSHVLLACLVVYTACVSPSLVVDVRIMRIAILGCYIVTMEHVLSIRGVDKCAPGNCLVVCFGIWHLIWCSVVFSIVLEKS